MISVLLLGVLTVAFAAPAGATAPDTVQLQLRQELRPDVCEFPIEVAFTVDLRIVRFYDDAGTLTRRVVHARETDAVFTNLETGKAFDQRFLAAFRQLTDDELPLSDQVTLSGLWLRVKPPGERGVVVDAGRFVLDFRTGDVVFAAGPKAFLEDEWAVLCPFLA